MKKLVLVFGVICLLALTASAMAAAGDWGQQSYTAGYGQISQSPAQVAGGIHLSSTAPHPGAIPVVPEPVSMMLGVIGLSAAFGLRKLRKSAA